MMTSPFKIHTFGDSHAREPWSKIKGVSCNVLLDKSDKTLDRTMTCSFFGFEKLRAVNIKNHGVRDGDVVLFCLGELDCRCHIHKHKNYKELIDRIVENYILAIKENADQFKNLKVIIVSITPPLPEKYYKGWYRYPMLGSDSERVMYTRLMNQRIKETSPYLFLDIYDKYCDENGLLELSYSDKICHIINPLHAKGELNKLL